MNDDPRIGKLYRYKTDTFVMIMEIAIEDGDEETVKLIWFDGKITHSVCFRYTFMTTYCAFISDAE